MFLTSTEIGVFSESSFLLHQHHISNLKNNFYEFLLLRHEKTHFFLLSFPFELLVSTTSLLFSFLCSSKGFLSFSLSFRIPTFSSTRSLSPCFSTLFALSLSWALVANFFNSLQNSETLLNKSAPENRFLADKVLLSFGVRSLASLACFLSALDLIVPFPNLALCCRGVEKLGSWFSASSTTLWYFVSLFENPKGWFVPLFFSVASLQLWIV